MHVLMMLASRGQSHGGSLLDTFLHSLARAFAWRTVGGLFHSLGGVAVVVGLVVAAVALYRHSWRGGRR